MVRHARHQQQHRQQPDPVPAGPAATRTSALGTLYLAADGSPDLYQYNDLPVAFDANVNIGEIPYTPPTLRRRPGIPP